MSASLSTRANAYHVPLLIVLDQALSDKVVKFAAPGRGQRELGRRIGQDGHHGGCRGFVEERRSTFGQLDGNDAKRPDVDSVVVGVYG